jgi:hypothetical protein
MTGPDLAAYRLPNTDALDGRAVALELLGGGSLELRFGGPAVEWRADGVAWAAHGTDRHDAVEVESGTFFVDIDVSEPAHDGLSLLFSDPTGWALAIHQRRHPTTPGARGPAVRHTFATARLAGRDQVGLAPAPTRDLVGRWHRYRYSPDNLYEHIYISADRFLSHNVDTQFTPDRADCHPVSYYRFGPDLYVVTWREFDSQVAMVLVENLRHRTATGKALHPAGAERSVSTPIGGRILPVQVIIPEEDR